MLGSLRKSVLISIKHVVSYIFVFRTQWEILMPKYKDINDHEYTFFAMFPITKHYVPFPVPDS